MVYPALIVIGAVCLSLQACTAVDVRDLRQRAESIAATAGLRYQVRSAGVFDIATWWRGDPADGGAWRVYIEGDGAAWRSRRRVSADPTPADPVALRLAAADPAPRVLYLARPCQYVLGEQRRNCDPRYWSGARYGQEVLRAYLDLVGDFLAGEVRLDLVGYSGGGVLAGLLAARLDGVNTWVSVAANLDHRAWTDYHRVSTLTDSLELWNDVDVLGRQSQWHLWGADDQISPAGIQARLFARLNAHGQAHRVIEEGFDHHCCWAREWPRVLAYLDASGRGSAP